MSQVYFFLSLLFLALSFDKVQGQNKLDFYFEAFPLIIPISKAGIEYGYGYYSVSGDVENAQSAYIGLNWMKWKKIGFNLGIGLRTFGYNSKFNLYEKIDHLEIEYNNSREISAFGWSPLIGVNFVHNKLSVDLCITEFRPFNVKSNAITKITTDTYYNLNPPELIRKISFFEEIDMITFPTAYNYWQLKIGYKVSKSLNLKIGLETTLKNNGGYQYRLQIADFDPKVPDVPIYRNDFRILSKFTAIKLGAVYNFDIK